MLPSLAVQSSTSASLSLRRARVATLRTSVRVNATAITGSRRDGCSRQSERLADNRFDSLAAANALRAHPASDGLLALLDADSLQVGSKRPTADASRLTTVAPQVFRLSALGQLIAADRLLVADFTVLRHDHFP